ncbi:hypothetical protein SAMN04487983_103655 [Streptomyces sp. yr375]|uniref:hypothetical protein n=1 Tax=Streptomyces sp. yr375 TaxID=1761906 RepID=UPI0008CB8E30|nr:hypothetical protein [Streptomyces sp. yr375]SES21246.1 hypothetical protein SAMN04487983_103655 [Streptomyces sp. yr375]
MNLVQRIIATGAVTATCAGAVALASTYSTSHHTSAERTATVVDGAPGYLVEDYNYPGADAIKAQKGIVLKRGDGHITLADCASSTGLMEVYSRKGEKICFRATGPSGYLSLEIPSVYGVKGEADHEAAVQLTTDGATQSIDVGKGEWKAAGEAADPEGRAFVLVEIRTSK